MIFKAVGSQGETIKEWRVYSVGGGNIADDSGEILVDSTSVYESDTINEALRWCETNNKTYWEYVLLKEGESIYEYLGHIWDTMLAAVNQGLNTESLLPGPLGLQRKAALIHKNAQNLPNELRNLTIVSAYALAVAEENASGKTVATAPTCGSAGIVPAVLFYFFNHRNANHNDIRRSLMTAGLFGSSVAHRASISGAQVGCQGEIGTACAMAAAAAAQLFGGNCRQIEYAAEIALEHNLGLTCDPVAGLVQIPCIERNAFAATRALESAAYAISTDGIHRISFDNVVDTMNATGRDMQIQYRETSTGGLAKFYLRQRE
jgi:L-serine dehydratase